MEQVDVDAALTEAARWLDEIPAVVGVGQGEEAGSPTVDVWVEGDDTVELPGQVSGVPVRVRRSGGPISAQDEPPG